MWMSNSTCKVSSMIEWIRLTCQTSSKVPTTLHVCPLHVCPLHIAPSLSARIKLGSFQVSFSQLARKYAQWYITNKRYLFKAFLGTRQANLLKLSKSWLSKQTLFNVFYHRHDVRKINHVQRFLQRFQTPCLNICIFFAGAVK